MADEEAAKGKKRKLDELEKEARDFVETNDPLKRTLTEVKDSDVRWVLCCLAFSFVLRRGVSIDYGHCA